jgi:translation initiation factor 2 subunit 1
MIGRPEWPGVGELVVATVRHIESYGAYVTLDEYDDKEGLLHISEISPSWVRNIRDYVREGQKVVLQVLRVDKARGEIDLSLRRVSKDERRRKMKSWKQERRAETILMMAAERLSVDEEEAYREGLKLLEHYGSLYTGLEAAVKRGVEPLLEAGVSKKMAEALAEISMEKIILKGVTVHGFFKAMSTEPKGVEMIREILLKGKRAAEAQGVEVSIYAVGAPRYRVEVRAEDYKKAEAALKAMIEAAEAAWRGRGELSFERE